MDEIEPPSAETDVIFQPVQPLDDRFANLGVCVVEIRGDFDRVATIVGSLTFAKKWIVADDGVSSPIYSSPARRYFVRKRDEAAIRSVLSATMVDDDVAHGCYSGFFQSLYQRFKLRFIAVLATVQVVNFRRHVTVLVYR